MIPGGCDYGVFTYDGGNLTITGNGTLDFSGNAYSIYSSGTLTIENASVVATSNNYPINSRGTLTIKNASVVAKPDGAYSINSSGDIAIENATVISNSNGYYSIFSDAALTITNSYVSAEATNVCIFARPLVLGEGLGITEPLGGQNSGKMITLNGQNVQKAVIQPAYSVELSANPTDCGSVSGAGSYAKDGATAKVTATPNEHYNFVNWTENGDEVSTDAEY
ncbi:MAG: carbohydrate-binding domain-containing protein, partial [Clostridia bacterium]|nr:carbohydrate-binding domain-containing protein [Clostridia bacterium]